MGYNQAVATPLRKRKDLLWGGDAAPDDLLDACALTELSPGFEGELSQRRWLLVHGDTYDLLPLLPPTSIDLVFTSPPYWGHRSYGQDHNWDILQDWEEEGGSVHEPPPYDWYRRNGGVLGLEPVPEWFVAFLVELFERARPALKPEGSLWVNLGDTYFAAGRASGTRGARASEIRSASGGGPPWGATARRSSCS